MYSLSEREWPNSKGKRTRASRSYKEVVKKWDLGSCNKMGFLRDDKWYKRGHKPKMGVYPPNDLRRNA